VSSGGIRLEPVWRLAHIFVNSLKNRCSLKSRLNSWGTKRYKVVMELFDDNDVEFCKMVRN
jgi:hypothetical protein